MVKLLKEAPYRSVLLDQLPVMVRLMTGVLLVTVVTFVFEVKLLATAVMFVVPAATPVTTPVELLTVA